MFACVFLLIENKDKTKHFCVIKIIGFGLAKVHWLSFIFSSCFVRSPSLAHLCFPVAPSAALELLFQEACPEQLHFGADLPGER